MSQDEDDDLTKESGSIEGAVNSPTVEMDEQISVN